MSNDATAGDEHRGLPTGAAPGPDAPTGEAATGPGLPAEAAADDDVSAGAAADAAVPAGAAADAAVPAGAAADADVSAGAAADAAVPAGATADTADGAGTAEAGAGADTDVAAEAAEAAEAAAADVGAGDDVAELREMLTSALMVDDPTEGLWRLVGSGWAERIVPELPALSLEQDPIHRHKDVLAHTVAVTAKTPADLRLRLAALFHDIGKPATRSYEHGKVTFYQHEAVGARITRRRLRALQYPPEVVADVTELVRLSGRFKGFASGWSDAAVRRYARVAGHLLGHLNELVRCDCTTRNRARAAELQHHVDHLEERIRELAEAERAAAERPLLDGHAVMEQLGIGPGREVGEALKVLLQLRREHPELTETESAARLDAWWAGRRPAEG